jgi:hypothetical protein
MVIGKDADGQSGEALACGAKNSTQALDSSLQLHGIRSGIRRQPGQHKVRSSSVMSFGGTTEFGCEGPEERPAPKPWWEHEAAAVHSMWPENRKSKRKHKRNAHKSGGEAFKIASAGSQNPAKDAGADSPEFPESSLKCKAGLLCICLTVI